MTFFINDRVTGTLLDLSLVYGTQYRALPLREHYANSGLINSIFNVSSLYLLLLEEEKYGNPCAEMGQ